jgi:thymidylate synthase
MKSFEFESIEEGYPILLKTLLEEGKDVSPRGQLTKEISPLGFTINNPRKAIYYNPLRKANYGFQIAEFLWMMRASNDLEEIAHYNKHWRNFSDDNITLNGAYGNRIFNYQGSILEKEKDEENYVPVLVDQFSLAQKQLEKDPDTRQATIVLFNPALDYRETKDKPCTNLMRFMIRDGKLNMTVFMRSNDAILGLYPYDFWNFVHIQAIMASKLGIEMGKYTHIADSFHIYEKHFELAQQIIDNPYLIKSLYNDNTITNSLPQDQVDIELSRVQNLEVLTRRTASVIGLEIIEKMLNDIQSDYWRSLAAVIAIYNLRKAKRNQEDIDKFKPFVVNEFKEIIKDWKTLKKD